MTLAILADIRANESALSAVLEHCAGLGVTRMWVIGSMLSHGPDPLAVADRLRASSASASCLVGHTDLFILRDPTSTLVNPATRNANDWAHRQVRPRWWSSPAARARWAWLLRCPSQGSDGGLQIFSGTPVDPAWGFLPTHHYPEPGNTLEPQFAAVRHGAFVGSIGLPGIVFATGQRWHPTVGGSQSVRVDRRCFIACPGSVGQPRDGDPRACFATFDGTGITWHRVAYDIAETMRRIQANPWLSRHNASRLEQGR